MKGHTVEEVLEGVEGRAVPDDEDCTGVVAHGLTEPRGDPVHHLLVAFTVWEWLHEMTQTSLLDLGCRPPRQIPVVAFTKPGVADNRKRRSPNAISAVRNDRERSEQKTTAR